MYCQLSCVILILLVCVCVCLCVGLVVGAVPAFLMHHARVFAASFASAGQFSVMPNAWEHAGVKVHILPPHITQANAIIVTYGNSRMEPFPKSS